MYKVKFTGWVPNVYFNIPFTLLVNDYINFGLYYGKQCGDKILRNQEVIIEFENLEVAKEFAEKANIIGAICMVINPDDRL